MRSQRLGFVGKWVVPRSHLSSVEQYGLSMQKSGASDTPYSVIGDNRDTALPLSFSDQLNFGEEGISAVAQFLHKPIDYLANTFANETITAENVLNAAAELSASAENVTLKDDNAENVTRLNKVTRFLGQAFAQPLNETILNPASSLESNGYLANSVSEIRTQEATRIRDELHGVINFLSTGYLDPKRIRFGFHHSGCDHDDGCEDVSEQASKDIALKGASEVFGELLPGFRFDKDKGLYSISLAHDIRDPHHIDTSARRILLQIVQHGLNQATDGAVDISGHHNPNRIYLTGQQLQDFTALVHNELIKNPNLYDNVLEEEASLDRALGITEKQSKVQASPWFSKLSETSQLDPEHRVKGLLVAAHTMQDLLDKPEMRKLWRKYNITRTVINDDKKWELSDGLTHDDLEAQIEEWSDFQGELSALLKEDTIDEERLEAIVSHFSQAIASGRFISQRLAWILSTDEDTKPIAEAYSKMDDMLRQASVADVAISEDYLEGGDYKSAHYLGRHLGLSKINYSRAFNEWSQDFFGDIINFYKSSPIASTAMVLLFYDIMSGNAGAIESSELPYEFSGGMTFDPLTGMPVATAPPDPDALRGECHWHIPFLSEHCIVTNAAKLQMQDAVLVLKQPMLAVMDTPTDVVGSIGQLRGEGAMPIQLFEGVEPGATAMSNVLFPLNQAQNAWGHAPWFATATLMGAKLGFMAATGRASVMISPVVDVVWSMSSEKPLVPIASAYMAYNGWNADASIAGADGSTIQALSGLVSGSIFGGVIAQGAHGVIDLARRIPNSRHLSSELQDALHQYTREATWQKRGLELHGGDKLQQLSSGLYVSPEIVANETAFPSRKNADFDIDFCGNTAEISLNHKTHKDAVKTLQSILFRLDTIGDKIGIDDDEQEWYGQPIRDRIERLLEDLEEYASNDDFEANEIKAALSQDLPFIAGFEYRHFGHSRLFETLTGDTLKDTPKKILGIQAANYFRELRTNELYENLDLPHIHDLFERSGKLAAKGFKGHKIAQTLHQAKLASYCSGTVAKVLLRNGWEGMRDSYDNKRLAWHQTSATIKNRSKSALIGTAGFALVTDFVPAAQDWLRSTDLFGTDVTFNGPQMVDTALPFVPEAAKDFIKDNSIFGQEATFNGVDATLAASHGMGSGIGAGIASALFGIYNFGEDHLFVHTGLGLVFITVGSASYGVYKLGDEIVLKPIQTVDELLYDNLKPYRVSSDFAGDKAKALYERLKAIAEFETDPSKQDHHHHHGCAHDHGICHHDDHDHAHAHAESGSSTHQPHLS